MSVHILYELIGVDCGSADHNTLFAALLGFSSGIVSYNLGRIPSLMY